MGRKKHISRNSWTEDFNKTIAQNSNRQMAKREQNNCNRKSGTDLNVPGQQNHDSSQNMEASGFGDHSHKYDDRPQRSGKQNHEHQHLRNGNSETQQNSKQVNNNNQEYFCSDNYYGNSHLQGEHHYQGSYKDGRHQNKHSYNRNFHHYQNSNQETKPEAEHSKRSMECSVCKQAYNEKDRKPRNLKCGHSFCSICAPRLIQNCSIQCPLCCRRTDRVKTVDDLSVNFSLLDVLSMCSFNSAMTVSNLLSGSNSQAGKREAMKASVSVKPKEKSPHSSNCLKAEAIVNAHCAKCDKWVCSECGRIDHCSNDCVLIPYKEALSQMVQAKGSVVENAHQNLKKSVSETKDFCDKLVACSVTMETTLDCIKKEQKHLEKMLEDSIQMEAHLQSTVADMPTAKTLSETLSVFKMVDETVGNTLQWASSLISSNMNNRLKKLSKELLFTTVQTHSASTRMQISGVLAMHTVNNNDMFSKLVYEGSRIHVSALVQTVPPSGSHALPLESIKCCIDGASALTFLELSCGGSHLGRVYIRLTGDTLRGRQFLTLCMGEEGPSFRNTHFHRIWWKGLPGEHAWAGDYDQGDGSGVTEIKNCVGNDISIEAGRKVCITAGLVAGRYEKKDVSSIFRIFTKDAKDAVEEAAFGQVEYGLQYIETAIKHNNIQSVIISDCGIVIES